MLKNLNFFPKYLFNIFETNKVIKRKLMFEIFDMCVLQWAFRFQGYITLEYILKT